LFFAITRNHEYAAATLKRANAALKELDMHIEALNKAEHLIDCFQGKKPLDMLPKYKLLNQTLLEKLMDLIRVSGIERMRQLKHLFVKTDESTYRCS
jgi:hypothetical protein